MQYRVTKPTLTTDHPNVRVIAVDLGVGKFPQLWEVRKDILVLKVPGGTGWSGRGETRYYPTYFQVCRILSQDEDYWVVEEIIDFPVR